LNDSFKTSHVLNESFKTLAAFLIHSIVTLRVRRVTPLPLTCLSKDAKDAK